MTDRLTKLWLVSWPVLGIRQLEKPQKDSRVGGVLESYRQMSQIQDCLAMAKFRASGLLRPKDLTAELVESYKDQGSLEGQGEGYKAGS